MGNLIVGSGFWDGEIAKYVRSGKVFVLDRLLSYYEEADTRLLLHASHAPESVANFPCITGYRCSCLVRTLFTSIMN